MALSLALSQSITNYTSLTLTDASGEYSSDNLTGWGNPNIALSDVAYAHLVITSPGGVAYDVDIDSDLGITLSTSVYADLIYNIPYSLLGGSTGQLLPDGVWGVEYQISTDAYWIEGSNTNYTFSTNVMTYYEVQSDVYDRIKLLPEKYKCSSCDNQFVKETTTIFMLLQALIASTQYANTTRFTEILEALEDILSFDSTNCQSCGC